MKPIFTVMILIIMLACNTQETSNIIKLNASQLKEYISKEDIQLIDVRTSKEFNQGHITNAKSLDYFSSSFKTELNKLNKEKPIYLYCRSGKRSGKASEICNELGFKKIYDLNGGYLAWSKENK
ncbi:rhodanese-like domain-containing protein [Tenacibaculum sp. ZS6-P6]|uniref:rhodanese-like domain-containing protein n=1 Tax=Tenacibaculum sp. ZS6-P6 TaxID=3447503 RepID=UPI003F95D3D2